MAAGGRCGAPAGPPAAALIAVARGHAVFCRRDIARVMVTLRVEFSGRDHPVGEKLREVERQLVADCARLVAAGRRRGAIPPGPPTPHDGPCLLRRRRGPGHQPRRSGAHDADLAERTVRGLLSLP